MRRLDRAGGAGEDATVESKSQRRFRLMKDGLYKVAFQTPLGQGSGVVVLQGGKLSGGDSAMYYVGNYTLNADKFTAEVRTDAHSQAPGMQPVFGRDQVTIRLTGTTDGDTAKTTGTAPEAPGVSFQASLTRLSD